MSSILLLLPFFLAFQAVFAQQVCLNGGCTNNCKKNEVFETCSNSCKDSCDYKAGEVLCPQVCLKGCYCKAGLCRSDMGECVPICPKNEHWNTCPSACGDSCPVKGNGLMVCTLQCGKPRCTCKPGFKRDAKRGCVEEKKCPIIIHLNKIQ
ncbi:venom serine protease inhibitor-like [Culicoides brevitarsis]|uniref:venom serine protease inhibitor-like n=1 Tax=Culicoides brevitarsis TaxID=469753 RepID=UPI00307B69D9